MKCRPRNAAVLAKDYPPLSREALEKLAEDEGESPAIRAMAREELERCRRS